jgi:hypothetical protein
MLPRATGFNCSHALPFNIDKRTRGGRQALRGSGDCVPGRRIQLSKPESYVMVSIVPGASGWRSQTPRNRQPSWS